MYCVAEIDKLMRPVLVPVPCLAARLSPAACPWRVRSRPCVPSPAVGVPGLGLGRATMTLSLSLSPSFFPRSSRNTRGFSTKRDTAPDPDPEQSKANTNKPKRERQLKFFFRKEPRSPDLPTVWLCGGVVWCVCCMLCAVLRLCVSHSIQS